MVSAVWDVEFPFICFNNPSLSMNVTFPEDEIGVDYLRICSGLNIEGKCKNKACRANGKTVIHCVGMHAFDVIQREHEVKCPICKKWIQPVTCGFYECEYMFTGIKKERKDSPPVKVKAPA
jgi:hypothetical protein